MLKLSNLDKLYWKKEKITKGDLLHYYDSISSYILPYLKGRPVVLHRFPEGIQGLNFYQKDSGPHLPSFIKTITVAHTEKSIAYFTIPDKKSLLYVVNLGSIELHVFNARGKNLDKPDYFIFDLDPYQIGFSSVIETALAMHEICEENGIPNYCKTSGGTGLHVCIPLGGKYTYEMIKPFGALMARILHEKLPKITSLERLPKNRKKKVYIDVGQSQKMQTLTCPYAVRAFPHAPVATPLKWSEVNSKLDPVNFTIHTVPKRLKKVGDLLKPLLQKGIHLERVLKTLQKNGY